MSDPSGIVVIGSLNADIVLSVVQIAAPGQTVLAEGFDILLGGKGANQAVAASRFGAGVSMVGRLGVDAHAERFRHALKAEGIDDTAVIADAAAATGQAFIQVAANGQNAIVVAAGANGCVSVVDIDAAWPMLARAAWVLCQMEIPLATVEYLLARAAAENLRVLLNPSPVCFDASWQGWKQASMVVVNEHEAAALSGIAVKDPNSGREAASWLVSRLQMPAAVAVVTLGEHGVCVAEIQPPRKMPGAGVARHVPAQAVSAIDTTAAGDTFTGVLAAALAEGLSMDNAIDWAQRAAAWCVQHRGAMPSIPRRSQLVSHG